MHRFFARRLNEREAALLPEEAVHAVRVLRMTPGDPCQALMEGSLFQARIRETAPQVTLTLEEELPSPEPSVRLTLYQGIPKGEKMDYITQKCTEAGAARIVPVAFSRCVARWDGRDEEKKLARYRRIAAEAAKQAGRAAAPEICAPVSVDTLCRQMPGHELTLVPWEEARGAGIRTRWTGQKNVALVIGPEGGLSCDEVARMREAGALPVTLGPRIFRTETAGLAAIVSLLTVSGDME